jgi:hypothetical protein
MINSETLEKLLRITDDNNKRKKRKKKNVSMQIRRNQSSLMCLS